MCIRSLFEKTKHFYLPQIHGARTRDNDSNCCSCVSNKKKTIDFDLTDYNSMLLSN